MDWNTIEAGIEAGATWIGHEVAALVGLAVTGKVDLAAMEAADPMVAQAISAGEAMAVAAGIPAPTIISGAEKVLEVAQAYVAATGAGSSAPVVPSAAAAATADNGKVNLGAGLGGIAAPTNPRIRA